MGHGHHPDDYERRLAQFIANKDDAWWERLTKRLMYYIVRKHGPKAHRYARSPEDYAQEAITAVLELRRIFDFDGDKTFEEFLMSVCDSMISHQVTRPINRTVPLESRDGVDDDAPLTGYDEGKLVSSDRPDSRIEEIDAKRSNKRLPPDLRRLHDLNQTGKYTAKEKARIFGVPEATVRNWERRLNRRLKRTTI